MFASHSVSHTVSLVYNLTNTLHLIVVYKKDLLQCIMDQPTTLLYIHYVFHFYSNSREMVGVVVGSSVIQTGKGSVGVLVLVCIP